MPQKEKKYLLLKTEGACVAGISKELQFNLPNCYLAISLLYDSFAMPTILDLL